jgi:hypothetical protein
MNAKGKNSIKESKTKMTASTLMRLAGLSTMLGGLCMVIMGLFHPVNIPEAVTTTTWVNVHIAATAMGFFGLFGMAGLYARQAEKSGWLGLTGFALMSLWFGIVMPFSFMEAFILPRLATVLPEFVAGFLGMFTGVPSEIDLGILPTLWNLSGPMFILGPLLFGIATFRAGVLPRWAGGLLAFGALLIPVGAMVPAEYQPEVALLTIAWALTWLGYALFSERHEKVSEAVPGKASTQLNQIESK